MLQGNLVANKLKRTQENSRELKRTQENSRELKRTQENSRLVSARIELIEIQPAFI